MNLLFKNIMLVGLLMSCEYGIRDAADDNYILSIKSEVNSNAEKVSLDLVDSAIKKSDTSVIRQDLFFNEKRWDLQNRKLPSNYLRRDLQNILINDSVSLQTFKTDSSIYLALINTFFGKEKIIHSTSLNEAHLFFGRFIGKLSSTIIWGYGSSTSNLDWILFSYTGEIVCSAGNYMGNCVEKGLVFFLQKNEIYAYSEKTRKFYSIFDLKKIKGSFSVLENFWKFNCVDNYIELIYSCNSDNKTFVVQVGEDL